MKRSIKDLKEYSVKAKDGTEGKVKDFLFDEEAWVIRYLHADFGSWWKSKKVLIPRVFLNDPQWKDEVFPVEITKDMIDKGPDIDEHMPVSREYEAELMKYYNLDPYWPYTYSAPTGGAMFFPPRPLGVPPKSVSEDELKTSLRSFKEIRGYHIKTKEEKLGHVDDLIVDDEDWQIVYMVVEFTSWLTTSKKVLISIEWLEEISYVDQEIVISMTPEKLKKAPQYDPNLVLNKEEEKKLHDFYSWGMTK
ncbi:MAG: PRC-barrel domain-containing protein [Bacteroidota bacterium]